jgi:hypothetical protein
MALVVPLAMSMPAQAKGDRAGSGGGEHGTAKSGTTNSRPQEKTPDQTPNDHPSGKDRTASAGKSGTQGKSTSDPDQMTNGGADKPGGAGGFDADKDGNNGCGNDDDFEDDNNGWCGRHKVGHKAHPSTHVEGTEFDRPSGVDSTEVVRQTQVLGEVFERTAAAPATVVAGTTAVRGAAAGSTLARTGTNSLALAAAGLLLAVVGGLLLVSAETAQPALAAVEHRRRRHS